MEDKNKKDLLNIISEDKDNKIYKLLDFTNKTDNIEDPWYTGRFDYVYKQIYNGCTSLFEYITNLGDKNEI